MKVEAGHDPAFAALMQKVDRSAFFSDWNRLTPRIADWANRSRNAKKRSRYSVALAISFLILPVILFGVRRIDPILADDASYSFCVLGGYCYQLAVPSENSSLVLACFLLGMGCFIYAFFNSVNRPKSGARLAKECVFKHLGFAYDQNASDFPFAQFKQLSLLSGTLGFRFCDMVSGEIDGITVRACSVKEKDAELSRASGRIIGGLIVADCTAHSFDSVLVVSRLIDYGNIRSIFPIGRGKRLRFGSGQFDNLFKVFSTNRAVANDLVTENFRRSLLRLEISNNAQISVAWHQGQVFVVVSDWRAWFPDPDISTDATDPSYLEERGVEIARIGDLLRELGVSGREAA